MDYYELFKKMRQGQGLEPAPMQRGVGVPLNPQSGGFVGPNKPWSSIQPPAQGFNPYEGMQAPEERPTPGQPQAPQRTLTPEQGQRLWANPFVQKMLSDWRAGKLKSQGKLASRTSPEGQKMLNDFAAKKAAENKGVK